MAVKKPNLQPSLHKCSYMNLSWGGTSVLPHNQPACDDEPRGCGGRSQNAVHKACPAKLAPYNGGVSRELSPAVRAFPVCRNESARGQHVSEAPPQAADPDLNAQLNRTAEVLCWPVASHSSKTQAARMPSTRRHVPLVEGTKFHCWILQNIFWRINHKNPTDPNHMHITSSMLYSKAALIYLHYLLHTQANMVISKNYPINKKTIFWLSLCS